MHSLSFVFTSPFELVCITLDGDRTRAGGTDIPGSRNATGSWQLTMEGTYNQCSLPPCDGKKKL